MNGTISLVRTEKTLDSKEYCNIISKYFLNDVSKHYLANNFFFVQDNAPIHTSKFTKSFFEKYNIETLPIPPNSPDLNPIENIWGILSSKVYSEGQKFKNKDSLWKEIKFQWENLDPEIIRKSISNYNERYSAVFQEWENITKY